MIASENHTLPPIHVIGIGLPPDGLLPSLPEIALNADVLVAGKKLLDLLPAFAGEKIPVTADTASLFQKLRQGRESGKRQCVLCSGDPLFFGLGARLSEALGPQALLLHPGLSSMQAAAALLGRPWENFRALSLHGRASRLPLARGLMSGAPLFILTDAANGPADIAAWMLERGLDRHSIFVLEDLRQTPDGSVQAGRCKGLSPRQALMCPVPAQGTRQVLILDPPPEPAPGLFGLRDEDIAHEKGIFSKQSIRAAALSALGPAPHHVIWDLGAGSGAVALEAAGLAREGLVVAVESKASRLALIAENRRRFGVANLEIVAGHMPDCLPVAPLMSALGQEEILRLPPDRIFMGGGLGGEQGDEILKRAWAALKPGGRLLASCVLLNSLERVRSGLLALGAQPDITCLQVSHSSPLAGDMRLEALNPVFLVLAEKT
ncbi:precorrin-6y C5,15-methyltransferase (decarboxylating) subunit CbiE [Desulfovibrio sp. OttesenSCG-928-M16]|nr:precorrin-6y C5,15-methyltransferase (decarboxylating) subunit CbiE [Desulfovibrio sp. OttesenSCG-928-M16]